MEGDHEIFKKMSTGEPEVERRILETGCHRPDRTNPTDEVMTHLSRLLLLLMFSAVVLLPSEAAADDAPIWLMGGGATPMSSHSTIRMDSEEVTIRLHKDSYTVDAIFHFFNTGETTTLWVGFPKRGIGSSATFTGTPDFIHFQTWIGNQQVAFREERELWSRVPIFLRGIFSAIVEDRRWMVKEVTFAGHTEATTRVKYEAPYHFIDIKSAYYIYGTGSYWKNNIGKATFIVDASEIGGTTKIRTNLPQQDQKQITEHTVTYELKDFEPPREATFRISLISPR